MDSDYEIIFKKVAEETQAQDLTYIKTTVDQCTAIEDFVALVNCIREQNEVTWQNTFSRS
jgi:hypothetical protein